ncbi:MAG: hypothetical protein ACJA0Q_001123 [Saprospiraceae bacterium]|jgi:hypothetical protein
MPFELLSEQTVLEREGYKEIKKAQGGMMKIPKWEYEVPTGYVRLNSMSKKGRQEALRVFPEAQGVMYVRVFYKLHKISIIGGFGLAEMQATLEVIVYNKANKKAMYVSRTGESEDRIRFALGGAFDAKEIRPLCEQATEAAYLEVIEYVQKKMQK